MVSCEVVEEEGEGEEEGGTGDEGDDAGREAHLVKEALKRDKKEDKKLCV